MPVSENLDQILACHDCGQLARLPVMPNKTTARCFRCDSKLFVKTSDTIDRTLALLFTSLILFIIANICYTAGFTIQLLTKNIDNYIIKNHLTRLLTYGLITSFLVICIPIVLIILNNILPEKFLELIDRIIIKIFNIIN